MAIRFPGESPEYRAARERLLQREIELRRAAEAAAQERRALPPGGVVAQDYVFEAAGADGAAVKVRLSELFGKNDSLAIYSYMFGPERERPCPMCTPLLDGLDGVEEHIRQRVTLVVVAESPIARLVAFAKERGWRRLRLVSAAGNTYTATTMARASAAATRRCSTYFTARARRSGISGARSSATGLRIRARTTAAWI